MTGTPAVQMATLKVSQIKINPRNVRSNPNVDEKFVKSIVANGVLVPVVVIPLGDGTYELTMGERRLTGARQAKRETIRAFILDPSQRTAGEEYIEMLIENDTELKVGLTELEKADALFGAVEAGMPLAAVAKRTGRTKAEVTGAAQTARSLSTGTRATLAEAEYEFDMATLSVLGEFDDDPDAVDRLLSAYRQRRLAYQVNVERADRAERVAREAKRAELRGSGVLLFEESGNLPESASPVAELHDSQGAPLDEKAHAVCPGRAVAWADDVDDPAALNEFCVEPAAYGHAPRPRPEELDDEKDTGSAAASAKPDAMPHAYKIAGNKAYRAAQKTRRTWVRDLIARKSAPKPMGPFVTTQLLTCPTSVEKWTGDVPRVALLAELLGRDKTDESRLSWVPGNATPARLLLVNFAVLAACFEKRLDQVQTWRHDEPAWDTEAIRADARVYLGFLVDVGYPLSLIEQAIVSGEPYNRESEAPEGIEASAEEDRAA
ncbi:ParB/RepB/Spo0J family partition protein [Streptomyces sp. NBC_01500]|uniref:ParB/RepB/Spo0J family partition protein n=1 Tax=Streptomyces sp. NBC_01500 TaxID=2903886 RepID=UPI00224D1CE4|nr:ParB/RepB/Spo0J family partition protein [Streptomyces sp. NBC_01500]MCX4554214.1 ParB/RepB/Spo0J family partition protein [Streptomyces sp. NBC_01500]